MDPARAEALGQKMLNIASDVFGDAMTGMIVKGSAIKGDFIPYFSDFDVHIFTDSRIMRGPLVPDISVAIPFQEKFSAIDVEAWQVSQIQVMIIAADNPPEKWSPPLPGSYRVLAGSIPPIYQHIDPDQFRTSAAQNLRGNGRWVDTLLGRIVDKPDQQLADSVRLAGTIMKAGLYEAAVVLGDDPITVWNSSLQEILQTVEPRVFDDQPASRYYRQAWNWRDVRSDGPSLRAMLSDALTALDRLSHLQDLPSLPDH
jgi:hypothetical protein